MKRRVRKHRPPPSDTALPPHPMQLTTMTPDEVLAHKWMQTLPWCIRSFGKSCRQDFSTDLQPASLCRLQRCWRMPTQGTWCAHTMHDRCV